MRRFQKHIKQDLALFVAKVDACTISHSKVTRRASLFKDTIIKVLNDIYTLIESQQSKINLSTYSQLHIQILALIKPINQVLDTRKSDYCVSAYRGCFGIKCY